MGLAWMGTQSNGQYMCISSGVHAVNCPGDPTVILCSHSSIVWYDCSLSAATTHMYVLCQLTANTCLCLWLFFLTHCTASKRTQAFHCTPSPTLTAAAAWLEK